MAYLHSLSTSADPYMILYKPAVTFKDGVLTSTSRTLKRDKPFLCELRSYYKNS